MSYDKLKGRIVEKYKTQERFAQAVSISNQTMSKKMNGKTNFSQRDIVTWCKALDIDLKDVGIYFFCEDGSKV